MRILFDTRAKHWGQNPYIDLLAYSLPMGVEALGFSWTRAIFGEYDLIHIHWPEYLLKMPKRYLRVSARILFLVWLMRIRLMKLGVIYTKHNLEPHVNMPKLDHLLLRMLDASVVTEIRLTRTDLTTGCAERCIRFIPHGDYQPFLKAFALDSQDVTWRDPAITRLFCFGIIKPYKQVHEVIESVSGGEGSHYRLRVAGQCLDEEYGKRLRQLVDTGRGNVELSFSRMEDADLVAGLLHTDFVVVPYDNLYSSGVLLLSLSIGTPVIVKDSPVARELAEEFGAEWIRIFSGSLNQAKLDAVTATPPPAPGTSPNLSSRDWTLVGSAHHDAYVGSISRFRRDGRI